MLVGYKYYQKQSRDKLSEVALNLPLILLQNFERTNCAKSIIFATNFVLKELKEDKSRISIKFKHVIRPLVGSESFTDSYFGRLFFAFKLICPWLILI